jgi:hypothetical protein
MTALLFFVALGLVLCMGQAFELDLNMAFALYTIVYRSIA